jgi:cytochrome c oxidase subunit II
MIRDLALSLALPWAANQSALDAHGAAAADIASLSWVLFAGAAIIFIGVMALAGYAILAAPARRAWMTRNAFIVCAGVVFPVAVLTVLLFYALHGDAEPGPATERIEVTGEQWWWRVHYLDANGRRDFATANEIRIPAGQRVELALHTGDVIHSFWVPSLAGKLDMIPGRVNRMILEVATPGEYRGQCAEYCGGPHARMALFVIALHPAQYDAWKSQQRRDSVPPATGEAERGQARFRDRGCGVCHRVAGTDAVGDRGPDLTHVGSRTSLAAATLPNDRGALGRWIRDGQRVKPENLMPSYHMLPVAEVNDIAAYLEALR